MRAYLDKHRDWFASAFARAEAVRALSDYRGGGLVVEDIPEEIRQLLPNCVEVWHGAVGCNAVGCKTPMRVRIGVADTEKEMGYKEQALLRRTG